MASSFLRSFIFLLFVFVSVTSRNEPHSILRVYSNLAEIIQPLGKLPLEFTDDDWKDIRSDSITLLGEDLNVTSQSITEKQNSLNGAKVYVRSPVSIDKASVMLVEATLVDKNRNLVKVKDESIFGKEVLYYFTVPRQDIFYAEEPLDSKTYVDFTYTTSNSKVFVSYLRSNVNWQAQYQLNLDDNKSDLIVMANIRNNGKSSVLVDQAELFSGDINLGMRSYQHALNYPLANTAPRIPVENIKLASGSIPTIEQSEEFMGFHVFAIKKPFVIHAQTNYLFPMFRPRVNVERYYSISKSFSGDSMPKTGTAERSYSLKSDRYLPNGNCIVRELNRVVGETELPKLTAEDKYEFSIGQDPEIIYIENVTLISSDQFREEVSPNPTFTRYRTRSVYQIYLQVKNLKNRSIKVEYTQLFSYFKLKLLKSTDDICVQDNSSIKCKIALNANDDQVYSYNVELVNN